MQLRPNSKCITISLKILACFGAIWSILLLVTETSLIFGPKEAVSVLLNYWSQNVWKTFTFTMVVMGGVIATSFFTIFKLKFSDYL